MPHAGRKAFLSAQQDHTDHGYHFGVAKHKFERKYNTLLLPFYDHEPHILDRVKLRDIKESQCRWPYGDPFDGTFAFCGRKVHKRGYCLDHFNRANVPLPADKKG